VLHGLTLARIEPVEEVHHLIVAWGSGQRCMK
jgi:hypothetical protein